MNRQKACDVLGVGPNSTPKERKNAYRRESMKRHPDRPGGSDEAFKELQAAFNFLENHTTFSNASASGFTKSWKTSSGDFKEKFYDFGGGSYKSTSKITERVSIPIDIAFNGGEFVIKTMVGGYPYIRTVLIKPALAHNDEIIVDSVNGREVRFVASISGRDSYHNTYESNMRGGEFSGDLSCYVSVPRLIMMFGGSVDFTFLDGVSVKIKIPSNQNDLATLRLKGKGFWSDLTLTTRGNLFLILETIDQDIDCYRKQDLENIISSAQEMIKNGSYID